MGAALFFISWETIIQSFTLVADTEVQIFYITLIQIINDIGKNKLYAPTIITSIILLHRIVIQISRGL